MMGHLLFRLCTQLLQRFVDCPPLISSANCKSLLKALKILELRWLKEVDRYTIDKGIANQGWIVKLFAKGEQFNSLFIVEVHLALKLVHRHFTFWNKHPNWQEANQLAIYKRSRELSQGLPGTNPASGQSGTWTRDLQISSPAPWPLSHAAS